MEARKALENAVRNTALYRSGALKFGRPSFPHEMNSHLLELATKDQMNGKGVASTTSTLVAFCGGTNLGSVVNDAVNDAVAAVKMVARDSNHAMEFVQENYGHVVVLSKEELAKAAEEAASFEQAWKTKKDDVNGYPDQVHSVVPVVVGGDDRGGGCGAIDEGRDMKGGGGELDYIDEVLQLIEDEVAGEDHKHHLVESDAINLPNQPASTM